MHDPVSPMETAGDEAHSGDSPTRQRELARALSHAAHARRPSPHKPLLAAIQTTRLWDAISRYVGAQHSAWPICCLPMCVDAALAPDVDDENDLGYEPISIPRSEVLASLAPLTLLKAQTRQHRAGLVVWVPWLENDVDAPSAMSVCADSAGKAASWVIEPEDAVADPRFRLRPARDPQRGVRHAAGAGSGAAHSGCDCFAKPARRGQACNMVLKNGAARPPGRVLRAQQLRQPPRGADRRAAAGAVTAPAASTERPVHALPLQINPPASRRIHRRSCRAAAPQRLSQVHWRRRTRISQ